MSDRTNELASFRRIAQSAVSGLFLLLPACSGSMEDPKIELNSNASMRYEIIARIEGSPVAFDGFSASVNYRVTNESCVPMTPVSGIKVAPTKRIDLEVVPIGNNEYRMFVFTDRLKDEDYFGKGICHWSLDAASVIARKGETDFSAGIFQKDITTQSSGSTYYSKNALAGTMKVLDSGSDRLQNYADASNTFAISMAAKDAHDASQRVAASQSMAQPTMEGPTHGR